MHVLSCFVYLIKKCSFDLLCFLDLFFQNAGSWQSTLFQIIFKDIYITQLYIRHVLKGEEEQLIHLRRRHRRIQKTQRLAYTAGDLFSSNASVDVSNTTRLLAASVLSFNKDLTPRVTVYLRFTSLRRWSDAKLAYFPCRRPFFFFFFFFFSFFAANIKCVSHLTMVVLKQMSGSDGISIWTGNSGRK